MAGRSHSLQIGPVSLSLIQGFNYEIGALDNDENDSNELALAFRQMYDGNSILNFQRLVQTTLPFTSLIVSDFLVLS